MFLFDVLWWRQADRMLRPLRRAAIWRALLALFMGAQLACFTWVVIGRIFGQDRRASGYSIFVTATYLWHMMVLLPTTLLFAGGAALAAVRSAFQRTKAQPRNLPAPEERTGTGSLERFTTRRQFITAAAVAAPPLATVLITSISDAQRDNFRIRSLDIVLPNLPRDLEGLRIAHVTDIHVGSFTNGKLLTKVVEATNALRPDLVLLTGDLINVSLSDLPAGLDTVRRMDPKGGFYMCEGNHDLFEDADAFDKRTRAAGVPLLVNDALTLKLRGVDVQLLGLRWGGPARNPAERAHQRGEDAVQASMRQLVPLLQPGAFPILMAHHPHAFDAAAQAGIPLTLAGHTHGGQLMLTRNIGFGPAMYRYWSGLYQKNGGANQLVVSNGVGNWFPLRVNAPAEIISITLHRD
jgi:predicted MPP superfamily phosphohydrolase